MNPFNIILFEDDPIISWDLDEKLKRLNHRIFTSCEAADDIMHVDSLSPCNLLITNLKLTDGWIDDRFIGLINDLGHRVIILTGLSNHSLFDLSEIRVPFVFLPKPFTILQLKKCLMQIAE